MDINDNVIDFIFQKIFTLRKSGVAIFADVTKIAIFFIKTIFIHSRKVKRIISFFMNMQSMHVFLHQAKFADFR